MNNHLTRFRCFNVTSLEEAYEALRTFEVLGIDKKLDISTSSCQSVLKTLWSASSASKDLFYALKVNRILKCEINDEAFEVYFLFYLDLLCCFVFGRHCFYITKNMLQCLTTGFVLIFICFLKGIVSRLQADVNGASSLLDFYYSIGSLVLIKVMNA